VQTLNKRLFGTSGIRGLVNEKLIPPTVAKIALAFAMFLGNKGEVGIGMDARVGSFMIKNAFTAGLLAGGLNVIDYGLTSTPALLHAVKREELSGGVAVTGSHTPPQIHGVLLFKKTTAELFREDEELIEEIFFKESFKTVEWIQIGKAREGNAEKHYIKNIVENFGEGVFKSRRVVLDAGHSPAVYALTEILEKLGCQVTVINGDVNGFFPKRPPNPLPEYLDELRRTVVDVKADFGVAVDGDGDRAVFVDEKGRVVTPDYMGALFAKHELERKSGAIVCPINTSSLINYVIEKYGGHIVYTKVGPPAMAEALMKTENAVFAFEETGKYIWPDNIYYGDPAYAAAKTLQFINEYEPLSQLIAEFPTLYQEKVAIPCPDQLKPRLLKKLREELEGLEGVELILVDGIKAVFENGDWILLRPSGTEPVFRCFVESKNLERLHELKDFALNLVKKYIEFLS